MNSGDCTHIAGIGGVGMSALAQALVDRGVSVTGSDRFLDGGRETETLRVLRREGVRLFPQDGSGIGSHTAELVVSTAVEEGNPDLAAAKRRGIPITHRSDCLARLAAGRRSVAIAGTSGKTTVTAMAGWVWESLGLDPTVINGGASLGWMSSDRLGSVRTGASDWFIFEADESDRSLLRYEPEHAVIGTISKDHFELDEVRRLFADFARRVRGMIIAGPGVADQLGPSVNPGILSPSPQVEPYATPDGVGFSHRGVSFSLSMMGVHNGWNALLVVELAAAMGLDLEKVAAALAGFKGVHRRLETVGFARGARVIDDAAHNPAKIRAAWQAAASHADRVVGVWRPHGFGPLRLMLDELVSDGFSVMGPSDRLFLLPVFYAGGTPGAGVSIGDLADRIRASGRNVEVAADYADLSGRVGPLLTPGVSLLIMGARDPELTSFARRMAGA